MDIPGPVFITIFLNKDRAENAEDRLISNIRRIAPEAIIQDQQIWEADIHRTALIFQIIFSGLALSILIVTSIILSAVVRTQLKASDETVKLVHLLGAHIKTIAGLFKNAVTRAAFWGVFLGTGLAAISLPVILIMLGLEEKLIEFCIYLMAIALIFILLCRLITHLTVLSSLKDMP
jgi:cell division protein FtsX